ncbi:VWA domain-containing protein [Streptococcus ratti]|uniref:VWA domain-containing protein n=1 Tax=Streptococcus ratti TaxID=1341 RepID=A0A7X9QHK4_STRRT|nr:VWA domain-containing protein [Streptococcus ratti]NMD49824.1 VWA domain-containing protein [Streptococcus ratti]
MEMKKRYSFRKLKFGLTSVAIAFVFGTATQVGAQETNTVASTPTSNQANSATSSTPVTNATTNATPASTTNSANTLSASASTISSANTSAPASTTSSANTPASTTQPTSQQASAQSASNPASQQASTSSVVAAAKEEVKQKSQTAVVPENQAKTGDVIAVETSQTDPKVTKTQEGNKEITRSESSTTVKTTSLAEPSEKVGKSAPVVEVRESSKTEETVDYIITTNEKVVKTITVEIVKEADTSETVAGSADIVFVIDHTGSMGDEIASVRNNIKNFVKGLADKKVTTRLGLVDYDNNSSSGVHYINFSGSNFTTDTDAFIQALDNIQINGSVESATIPLSYIANNYDWSTDPNVKRFAVLITDEDYDFDTADTPSVESAINSLKTAGISTTVITEDDLKSTYQSLFTDTNGIYIDIDSDFSKALSEDVSTWIVETIKEGRLLKIVTEKYDFYIEVIAQPKGANSTGQINPANDRTTPVRYDPLIHKTNRTSEEASLPETGSQSNAYLTVFGSAALAAGLALAFYKKQEEK